MLPVYVGAGTLADNAAAISPALPSGIQTNDILLLAIETANQAITIPTPNGGVWTEVTNSPQGTGTAAGTTATRLTVFWSRYNGTQGAPTTSDSGDHQTGQIFAFRHCISTGTPFNISSGNVDATSDTSLSATGATTTAPNCLVAILATLMDDAQDFGGTWTNTDLANITVRQNSPGTGGNDGRLILVTGEKASAGAYGATTNTTSASSVKGMMTIALMGSEDQSRMEDLSQSAVFFSHDDFHVPVFVPGGYQNDPGLGLVVPPEWQFEDDLANDDQFLIEASFRSQPVDFVLAVQAYEIDFDQADLYDDPVIELAEAMAPVQPGAPPAGQPANDEWPWLADEQVEATAVPGGYQQGASESPTDDPWEWTEALTDDDDWDVDQAISATVVAPVPNAYDDAWLWNDDATDDLIVDAGALESSPRELERDEPWFDDFAEELDLDDSEPVVADTIVASPMLPSSDWDWYAEDEAGHVVAIPGGYQNAEGAPNPVDTTWDWDETVADELLDASEPVIPNAVVLGGLASSDDWDFDVDGSVAPVASIDSYQQSDGEDQPVDLGWDWDEVLDEPTWSSFDAFLGANGVAAPPPILGFEWDFEADNVGFTATVESYQIVDADPVIYDDPWQYAEEIVEDHWQPEAAPLGADAVALPPAVVDVDWLWDDATVDLDLAEEYEPVGPDGALAQVFPDPWDFDADEVTPVSTIDSYQQSDGEDQPVESSWEFAEQLPEEWFDESAPVPPDAVAVQAALPVDPWTFDEDVEDDWRVEQLVQLEPALADDAWPWFDEVADEEAIVAELVQDLASVVLTQPDPWPWELESAEEHWQDESAPVGPDLPPNPLLTQPDPWPWHEEFEADEWVTGGGLDAVIRGRIRYHPRRRFVVAGEDRTFRFLGEDRALTVVGEWRVFKVRGKANR